MPHLQKQKQEASRFCSHTLDVCGPKPQREAGKHELREEEAFTSRKAFERSSIVNIKRLSCSKNINIHDIIQKIKTFHYCSTGKK